MANISVSLPSDGETIDVADYNTPINTIVNEINGGLDNSNITAAAAIAGSKLANTSVTPNKLSTGASRSYVATSQTTTSTSPVALATAQDVTVTIGVNGLALVSIRYTGGHGSADLPTAMQVALSGANTVAASTDFEVRIRNSTANAQQSIGATALFTGLTAGSTTFGARFSVSAGTGTFVSRELLVIPL